MKTAFTQVSLEQFNALAPKQQQTLRHGFAHVNAAAIQATFDQGADWVMFCGGDEPHLSAMEKSSIPSGEDIKAISKALNRPVFMQTADDEKFNKFDELSA